MAKVSAPSKLILFGEHAVVYDRFGIAAAIGLRTTAEAASTGSAFSIVNPPYGRADTDRETIDALLASVNEFMAKKDFKALRLTMRQPLVPSEVVAAETLRLLGHPGGAALKVACGVPEASGLGSSSSVFVAVSAAICACFGEIDRQTVAKASYLGDVIAHAGMPSGIDTGTCTYGGYVGFRKSEGIKPLSIGLRLPIVIGDTGVPAETATTVSAVREKKQEEPVKTDELFDGIDAVSRQALEALKKEDAGELGRLMNENQRLLAQLGVSHPALERLINSSLDAGALGAKLSGKGCGGVMFALCAGEAGQKKVALAIKRAGGTPIMTQVGAEGVVRA